MREIVLFLVLYMWNLESKLAKINQLVRSRSLCWGPQASCFCFSLCFVQELIF